MKRQGGTAWELRKDPRTLSAGNLALAVSPAISAMGENDPIALKFGDGESAVKALYRRRRSGGSMLLEPEEGSNVVVITTHGRTGQGGVLTQHPREFADGAEMRRQYL
jgi:hypothetical protein